MCNCRPVRPILEDLSTIFAEDHKSGIRIGITDQDKVIRIMDQEFKMPVLRIRAADGKVLSS